MKSEFTVDSDRQQATASEIEGAGAQEKVTLFSWLGQLSAKERVTMRGCFGGWALDAMDVQLYSLVIPTLVAAWSMTRSEAGMLATVALLLSAVGGCVVGYLCDRYGRVKMLQITIAFFAFFTFLSGFTTSYEQLFICRALQGLGFGGEWAAGSVLMSEVVRARYRGRAVGFVQSGWSFGWAGAVLLYTLFFHFLPEHLAWRLLFMIGILPAFLVIYLRRFIDEPEVFQRVTKQKGEAGLFANIMRAGVKGRIVMASVLTMGIQGSYYGVITWLPTFLKTERGLSVFNTGGYLLVIIIGNFLGFMIGAYLTDRIGRKRTFLVSAVYGIVIVYAYMYMPINNSLMLALGLPLGIASSLGYAPIGSFLTELFPTTIRATALGFTYNIGRAVGAIFPALVGFLSTTMPLGNAIGLFTIAGYTLMLIALCFLPETKGSELHN